MSTGNGNGTFSTRLSVMNRVPPTPELKNAEPASRLPTASAGAPASAALRSWRRYLWHMRFEAPFQTVLPLFASRRRFVMEDCRLPWYCCSRAGTAITRALPAPPSKAELNGNSSQETCKSEVSKAGTVKT